MTQKPAPPRPRPSPTFLSGEGECESSGPKATCCDTATAYCTQDGTLSVSVLARQWRELLTTIPTRGAGITPPKYITRNLLAKNVRVLVYVLPPPPHQLLLLESSEENSELDTCRIVWCTFPPFDILLLSAHAASRTSQ